MDFNADDDSAETSADPSANYSSDSQNVTMPPPSASNGSMFESADSARQARRQAQSRIAESRSGYRANLQKRLAEAYDFRLKLQSDAASNAGEVNLIYVASENKLSLPDFQPNTFIHPAPLDQPEVPDLEAAPEFEERPAPEAPTIESHRDAHERRLHIAEILAWIFAAFIGAFAGYGLFLLAGFKPAGSVGITAAAAAIGIVIYTAMKMAVYHIARSGSEQTAITGDRAATIASFVFVGFIVLADLALGSLVLQRYRDGSKILGTPLWENMLMAGAIGTPLLLFATFTGWRAGRHEDRSERAMTQRRIAEFQKHEEERKAHFEREAQRRAEYIKAVEERIAAYQTNLDAHRESLISELSRQRIEFLEATGHAQNSRYAPEYRTALKIIGQISALNIEIDRLEKELGKAGIAEGFQISELNK